MKTFQEFQEKAGGIFKSDKLNKMYPNQPEMTDKGKRILPNLDDPTIVRGDKVIHKNNKKRIPFGVNKSTYDALNNPDF